MKNIYNYIVFILVVLTMSSCFEEELLVDNATEVATMSVEGDAAFLYNETESVTFNFQFSESENAKIDRIIVSKQLILNGASSEVVELEPITEAGEYTFTEAELFSDVPVGGVLLTEDDLSPGDYWAFTFLLVTEDGREIVVNGNDERRVTFTCPSDLAGTYNSIASGAFGDGEGGQGQSYAGLTATIELAELSSGIYLIDDMSFGLYEQAYGIGSPDGRIQDVCGTITDQGDTDQYGDPFTMEGNVDENGVITLSWSNTYGDTGEVVLTPAG